MKISIQLALFLRALIRTPNHDNITVEMAQQKLRETSPAQLLIVVEPDRPNVNAESVYDDVAKELDEVVESCKGDYILDLLSENGVGG